MKKSSSYGDFPTEFVRSKVREVMEKYGFSLTEMAKLMGYKLPAFHKTLNNRVPSIQALAIFSHEYGLSMDFWFPPGYLKHTPPKLPDPKPLRGCVCHDASSLTLRILEGAKLLGNAHKTLILSVINDSTVKDIVSAALRLNVAQRRVVLRVMLKANGGK